MKSNNRTPTSTKSKKAVTRWVNAGETIHKRAEAWLVRHPKTTYAEGVRAVLRKSRKLSRLYNRAPARSDPLAELKRLVILLNNQTEKTEELIALRQILRSIKNKDATPNEVEHEGKNLAAKLAKLQGSWTFVYASGHVGFGTSFPTTPFGVIATSIRNGDFSKLKLCPECGIFFVNVDHRVTYCRKQCLRTHEAQRVKDWRTRTGA